jgi:hypothetical protein
MATYDQLLPTKYYLIQENENARVEMVYVPMATEKCVLLQYDDEEHTRAWYKRSDTFYELIEELTDEQATLYELITDKHEEEEGEADWVNPLFDEEDEEDEDDEDWLLEQAEKN